MQTRRYSARVTRIKRVTILTTIVALLFAMFPTGAWAANQNENPRPVSAMAQGNCTYVIRPGDTLYAIAVRYHVSVQYLAAINGIPCPNCIFAGSVLRVPCGGAPSGTICFHHMVQSGERLFRIAMRYGVSWQAIAAANHIPNPNLIFPGMWLAIPCGGAGPTTTPPEAFNQVVDELRPTGKIDQVNARLREIGLIPADKSVLDMVAIPRTAGWKGTGACPQSASSPYQVLVAPVTSNNLPTAGSISLIGAMVLPACRMDEITTTVKGSFKLLPTDRTEPIIYAMLVMTTPLYYGQQSATQAYGLLRQQFTYTEAVTGTPILNLVAPVNDLDSGPFLGSVGCRYYYGCPYVPEPIVSLGSIGFNWDGISWWWP